MWFSASYNACPHCGNAGRGRVFRCKRCEGISCEVCCGRTFSNNLKCPYCALVSFWGPFRVIGRIRPGGASVSGMEWRPNLARAPAGAAGVAAGSVQWDPARPDTSVAAWKKEGLFGKLVVLALGLAGLAASQAMMRGGDPPGWFFLLVFVCPAVMVAWLFTKTVKRLPFNFFDGVIVSLYGLHFLYNLYRLFEFGVFPEDTHKAAFLSLMVASVPGAALAVLSWIFGGRREGPASYQVPPPGAAPRPEPAATREEGGRSTATTAFLAMTLERDSGVVTGTVLAGRFQGRALASLKLPQLLALREEVARSDRDSVALLESYLDREWPGWQREAEEDEKPPPREEGPSPYTRALRVLDLPESDGAERGKVQARWRELVRRNHPDQGGSTLLVQQVNEAYEVIRARHGWAR